MEKIGRNNPQSYTRNNSQKTKLKNDETGIEIIDQLRIKTLQIKKREDKDAYKNQMLKTRKLYRQGKMA